jgi:hypothetical protein
MPFCLLHQQYDTAPGCSRLFAYTHTLFRKPFDKVAVGSDDVHQYHSGRTKMVQALQYKPLQVASSFPGIQSLKRGAYRFPHAGWEQSFYPVLHQAVLFRFLQQYKPKTTAMANEQNKIGNIETNIRETFSLSRDFAAKADDAAMKASAESFVNTLISGAATST